MTPLDETDRVAKLLYDARMECRKKQGLPVPDLRFDDLTKEVWLEYRAMAARVIQDHLWTRQ